MTFYEVWAMEPSDEGYCPRVIETLEDMTDAIISAYRWAERLCIPVICDKYILNNGSPEYICQVWPKEG